LTQDKFDIVPVCALARVSFTYLHTTIYTPPNEIPGYAPGAVMTTFRAAIFI